MIDAVRQKLGKAPPVGDISLPRMILGGDAVRDAIKQPPAGMFLVNSDTGVLEQWVMDHWEKIGAWHPGGIADDPLANFQLSAQRAFAGPAQGGSGSSPAPGGNPTTPAQPYPTTCVPVFQDPDPGAIGAGRFWFDTGSTQLFIRNATNTAWIEVCLA